VASVPPQFSYTGAHSPALPLDERTHRNDVDRVCDHTPLQVCVRVVILPLHGRFLLVLGWWSTFPMLSGGILARYVALVVSTFHSGKLIIPSLMMLLVEANHLSFIDSDDRIRLLSFHRSISTIDSILYRNGDEDWLGTDLLVDHASYPSLKSLLTYVRPASPCLTSLTASSARHTSRRQQSCTTPGQAPLFLRYPILPTTRAM
jgi:hypothetical protein